MLFIYLCTINAIYLFVIKSQLMLFNLILVSAINVIYFKYN